MILQRIIGMDFQLESIGSVVAGTPAEKFEVSKPVAASYILSGQYIARVEGESMIGAGIDSGDDVIISSERQPQNGERVIAEIDGEFTLKFVLFKSHQVKLIAANPDFPDIVRDRSEVRFWGVVVKVIKNEVARLIDPVSGKKLKNMILSNATIEFCEAFNAKSKAIKAIIPIDD